MKNYQKISKNIVLVSEIKKFGFNNLSKIIEQLIKRKIKLKFINQEISDCYFLIMYMKNLINIF